ncbi:MAG: HIT family protein [Chromatocurvus sp.]
MTGDLHPRLAADCHVLGRAGDARLLLSREAALHWFLLVPETDCVDLLDMPARARNALMQTAADVSALLKGALAYPKVNVGALGNVVPQLHVHVVGRRPGDFCWPDPVWGRPGPGVLYSDESLETLRQMLEAANVVTREV